MTKVNSINIGKPTTITYKGKEVSTSIYKTPQQEPIYLGKLGFQGDEQADLIHHGGEAKAVCVYPLEHYSYWVSQLQIKLGFAAFGENLTVTGMMEEDVCIGDTYKIGEAIVQVSQPRQPCYKVSAKYGVADFPELIQTTGYSGYYLRVLKEGIVEPNSAVSLVEKDPHQITIAFANKIRYQDTDNLEAVKKILAVPALSESWQTTFQKRL